MTLAEYEGPWASFFTWMRTKVPYWVRQPCLRMAANWRKNDCKLAARLNFDLCSPFAGKKQPVCSHASGWHHHQWWSKSWAELQYPVSVTVKRNNSENNIHAWTRVQFFVYKTMQATGLGTDATTHAILHIPVCKYMSVNWLRCFLLKTYIL